MLNSNRAKIALYTISSVALIYHVLIITRIIDFKNTWGGQLQNLEQMYFFEAFSIIVQLLVVGLITISTRYFETPRFNRTVTNLLFIFAAIMLLNTIGNLFAIEAFEKFAFTPLTFLSSICFGYLGMQRLKHPANIK
ncbi:MAG: hypothetical protein OHK0017_10340 [Patescibacteria group bacterium]